ncbi:MAG: PAS domain S-box protein [Oculatellaceae cyanobacterium bins.114]|nr:PAS domain S-box protein [Oculatellaceae cyanobacterium bins.114]
MRLSFPHLFRQPIPNISLWWVLVISFVLQTASAIALVGYSFNMHTDPTQILYLGGFMLVMTTAIAVITTRWITQPILRLQQAFTALAHGEGQPLSEDIAIAELKTLTQSFNQLREQYRHERDSKEQLQLLTDALPVFMSYTDSEQRYQFVNQAYETHFGMSREEICGHHVRDIIGETNYTLAYPWIQRALAGELVSHELTIPQAPESERCFSVILVPDVTAQSQVRGYYSLAIDVSDRKDIELALQISEAHQRALIQALPDLLMRINRAGIYLEFVNTPNFRVVGNLPELVGTHVSESLPPNAAQQRLTAIQTALQTQSIQIYEQNLSIDNNIQIEEVRVFPYSDDEVLLLVRDISDRKAAELALQASEARYRTLTEISPVAIFRFDASLNCVYVNDRWSEMTGRPKESALGKGWIEALHPDEREFALAQWNDISLQEITDNFIIQQGEGRHLRPDGSINWYYVQVARELDATGALIGYVGSLTDITDRKQVEVALYESEEQFRQIVDSINDVFFLRVVETGELLYLNPAYEQILQCSREITYQNPECWIDRIHPEDRDRISTKLQQELKGTEFFNDEYRIVHPDGSIRWIWDCSFPIRNQAGEIYRYAGMNRDITDRKLAELALQEALQTLTHHIETSPLATIRWNREFRVESWSNQAETIFGWTADEVMGKTMLEWQFIFEDDLEYVNQAATQLLQGTSTTCHNRNYRKDGSVIDCEWYNSILLDEQGNLVSILSLACDVSDRKQAEAALKESEARFQILVKNVPGMMYRYFPGNDGVGFFTYVSPGSNDLLELTPDRVLQDANSVWSLIHPDDFPSLQSSVAIAVQNCADWNWEGRLTTPSGRLKWIQGKSRPESTPEGVVWDGLLIDISDRKLTELALQESEERFREIANTIPQTFFVRELNPDQFAYIGPAYEKIWGRSRDELLENPSVWMEAIHPDDRDRVQAFIASKVQGNSGQLDYRIIRPDGSIRWISVQVAVIQDAGGYPLRFIGLADDITDRKISEIALAQEIFHRRTLFDTSIDGIVILDQAGHVIEANASFAHMLGYSLEEVITLNLVDFDAHWTRSELEQKINEFAFCDNTFETCHRRKDGSIYDVEVSSNPVDWSGQSVQLCICRDISDRKQAELVLQSLVEGTASVTGEDFFPVLTQQIAVALNVSHVIVSQLLGDRLQSLAFCADGQNQENSSYLFLHTPCERTLQNGFYYCSSHVQREFPLDPDLVAFESDSYLGIALQNNNREVIGVLCILNRTAIVNPQRAEALLRIFGARAAAEIERLQAMEAIQQLNTELEERIQRRTQDLRAEQLRLQLALDAANMGAWSCSLSTGQLNWSDRAQEIFGYVPGTFPGDRETFLAMVHPEDTDRVIEAIAHTFETGAPYNIEYRIHRLDGELRWLAVWGMIPRHLHAAAAQLIGVVADITDQKAASATLAEKNLILQSVIESTPDVIFVKDLEGRIITANSTFASFFGQPIDQLIGKDDTELWPPEKVQHIQTIDRRIMQTGIAETFEEWVPHPDGTRTYLTTKSPWYDNQNNVIGLIGLARDITDRKQAEQLLRDSEERLRLALRSTSQGLYDLNIQTGETIVSPEYATMLGYEPATFQETNAAWLQRLHPDDRESVAAAYRSYIAGESPDYTVEFRQRTQTGDWKWILSVGKIVAWDEAGQPLRMLGIHTDIGDRKQAERDLQESRNMLKLVLDTIPQRVFWKDRQSRFLGCNSAFAQDYQLTIDEIVGKTDLELPWADWAHLYRADDVMVMNTRTPKLNYEEPTNNLNGEEIWIRSSKIPLTSSQGEVLGVLGCYDDITNLKQAEAALQQINLELEQRIQERTVDLQQAVEAADAANRAKSLFLANMSHELRTPLNVILGFTQLLRRDSSLNLEQQDCIRIMHRSGDHLLHLINEILDLSKIEAGRTTLENTPIDLYGLLYDLRGMFQERAANKGLQFNLEINPNTPQFVITDINKLRQVLINLLNNAIKFTDQGSVELRVSADHPQVEQDSAEVGNEVERDLVDRDNSVLDEATDESRSADPLVMLTFEVEDTGVGIAPEEIGIIFDAFTQAEAGRVSLEGTGLGLAISRQIATVLGGDLSVRSTLAQGSTFNFSIPLCSTNITHVPLTANKYRVIGVALGQPTYRILVVDDQPSNRQLMVKLLTRIGLEVRDVASGAEAIACWQHWHPHLIWMDIRMPEMDGCETTQRIRELERLRTQAPEHESERVNETASTRSADSPVPTKIIAFTVQVSASDRTLALASGFDDFVSKPIQIDIILSKMADHLGILYRYQEDRDQGAELTPPSSFIPHPSSLQCMPPDWIAALHQAALNCDEEETFSLIKQVPAEHTTLIRGLNHLLQNYRFEVILQLTQPDTPSN